MVFFCNFFTNKKKKNIHYKYVPKILFLLFQIQRLQTISMHTCIFYRQIYFFWNFAIKRVVFFLHFRNFDLLRLKRVFDLILNKLKKFSLLFCNFRKNILYLLIFFIRKKHKAQSRINKLATTAAFYYIIFYFFYFKLNIFFFFFY